MDVFPLKYRELTEGCWRGVGWGDGPSGPGAYRRSQLAISTGRYNEAMSG